MARIIFSQEKCKGCKLCTTVCPKEIVTIDIEQTNAQGFHPAVVTDKEECTGCGLCARICPDIAIEVWK